MTAWTNKFLRLLVIATILGWVVLVCSPAISREYSFYNLKRNQSNQILNIIGDKKISYSEIDKLIDTTPKHSYESFACEYQDGEDLVECNKLVSTAVERNYKYIKWGLPSSEYEYMTDTDMKKNLSSLLSNTNYNYDRYTQYPNEELKILFNSGDGSNTTIMLTIDTRNNPGEISSLIIGKTDIFDRTYSH